MNFTWFFRKAVFTSAALMLSSCVAPAQQQADFNEVGKQMAIMLQNSHYARLPFDEQLGRRFLEDYLKDLDSQRMYFTRQDVNAFTAQYGTNLHSLLLQGKCMMAATDIYRVFEKRVEARVAQAEKMLQESDFDFSLNESVVLSRKNAQWPKDEKEAADLWRLQLKEAVLSEVLHRELLDKKAKEKADLEKNGVKTPKEKVALRYKRFLANVKDVDEEEIATYFLGAVARAYDPHTDYMSDSQLNRFKGDMKNELVGIGALLKGEEDGATQIMGIVIGGPADREGSLKLNDRIVAVDTLNTGKPEDMQDVMYMRIDKVIDQIRGKEGTSVGLKVEPPAGVAGETRVVVIKRDKVEMKDEQASGTLIEMKGSKGDVKRLGIITLPSFYADFEEGKVRCSVDVERILKRLVDERIDGLILDLRNNGGGALEEVRRMTGFFMDRGPVVQVKNTLGQVQVKESETPKPIYGGPMIIMTDKTSASASEILAGALQDMNRAVIVGESSTFGKGTVQQTMEIGRFLPLFAVRNKAGCLKVTIQKFYRPSGSSTQMDGVKSDIVFPSLLDALEVGEEYMDHALPHDRIRHAPDFRPLNAQALYIPILKERSLDRVKQNKDFSYLIEDVLKMKNRLKENKLSLSKEAREKEVSETDAQQKARNAERRGRFEKTAKEDKDNFKFFKITLDDLEKGADLKPYDPSQDQDNFMRRAKDDSEDLDETPKWPTNMDPVKRESISVLRDLIEITENAKLTGTTVR